MAKKATVCILLYGDFENLARRSISSVVDNFPREEYELRVGCNECSIGTLAYVNGMLAKGFIDDLFISYHNINKNPMMRRMFKDIQTEYIWWFDDDSHVTEPDTFQRWMAEIDRRKAEGPNAPVMYGKMFFFGQASDFDYDLDITTWIRSQRWYKERPVPCGVDRYDEQFNSNPQDPDTRFFFITGGCWVIRTEVINMLKWPTPTLVKRNDDVILCCAIRQNGFAFADYGDYGVKINDYERRGVGEDEETMKQQMGG